MNTNNSRYGKLTLDDKGRVRLRFERCFNHPVERVWQAITDPSDAFEFFNSVDMRLGGKVSIAYGNHVESYTITELSPPCVIAYRNDAADPGDDSGIDRWEITPDEDGCVVIFTTSAGTDDPGQLRICVGWHIWLDNWEHLLDGRSTMEELRQNWAQREQEVAGPYFKSLREIYPGWEYEREQGK